MSGAPIYVKELSAADSEPMGLKAKIQTQAKAQTGPAFTSLRDGLVQRKCACGASSGLTGQCSECDKEKPRSDRHSANLSEPSAVPPIVHETLRSPGQSLDADTRAFMESRFGHDFSQVRVHTGARAAESARAVNALAYTVGRNIVFGLGQYDPGTAQGRRILAHELAHTAQQGLSAQPAPETLALTHPGDGAEQEAEAAAGAIEQVQSLGATRSGRVQLARQKSTTPPLASGVVSFDRSEFGDKFDAQVNKTAHTVILFMRVNFTPAGWPSHIDSEAEVNKFKAKFKTVVENTWSHRFALQSVCHGDADKFQARVSVSTEGANPHATIYLHPDTPEGRSSAGDGQSAMQESDVYAHENTRLFQTEKGKPPKEFKFYQVTAAHEFGHLMGLQHIHCKGNETQCYGATPDQAMDIMGSGSVVSARDYKPFQQIMERYGRDALLSECNKWKLVPPG